MCLVQLNFYGLTCPFIVAGGPMAPQSVCQALPFFGKTKTLGVDKDGAGDFSMTSRNQPQDENPFPDPYINISSP